MCNTRSAIEGQLKHQKRAEHQTGEQAINSHVDKQMLNILQPAIVCLIAIGLFKHMKKYVLETYPLKKLCSLDLGSFGSFARINDCICIYVLYIYIILDNT